jgi:hypothetical protein
LLVLIFDQSVPTPPHPHPLQLRLRLGKSEVLFLEVSTTGFISRGGEDGRTGRVVNCSEVEDKLCVNVGAKTDGSRDRLLGAAASPGARTGRVHFIVGQAGASLLATGCVAVLEVE